LETQVANEPSQQLKVQAVALLRVAAIKAVMPWAEVGHSEPGEFIAME
jgi:hypothetical protein